MALSIAEAYEAKAGVGACEGQSVPATKHEAPLKAACASPVLLVPALGTARMHRADSAVASIVRKAPPVAERRAAARTAPAAAARGAAAVLALVSRLTLAR